MVHFYSNIHGWFNYEGFYSNIIKNYPSGSTMVEVGSWLGKSISFFTVESICKNKNFNIYSVDIWPVINREEFPEWDATNLSLFGGSSFKCFCHNTKYILDLINVIRCDSSKASGLFEDKSVDFAYIDASHDYEFVKKDIIHWLPKIKNGGILAGHDYGENNYPGVKKAVDEVIGAKNIEIINTVWAIKII